MKLYRVNPGLALRLTMEIHEGVLEDMGYIDYRPELEGVERARCGVCRGLIDRHGYCSMCKRFCGIPAYEKDIAKSEPERHGQSNLLVQVQGRLL